VFRKLLLLLLLAIVLLVGYEWLTFPDVAALAKTAPKTTAFMELRKEQLREAGKDDHISYTFVPYGRISPFLRRGVLVAEDDTFYEHGAVDSKGLEEAIKKNWKKRKLTHGGSTITQQLAKNLYLSPSRNPFRKLKEYFIARSLENNLTKKRILELYLNVAEMGERVYGAEAAARFYFHEPAAALSASQAALLAGCLPNPRVMNPGSPNKRLRFRQKMVLSRMRRWGYLYEKEVLTEKKPAAEAQPPTTAPATTTEAPPVTDTDLAPPAATDDTAAPTSTEESPPTETAEPMDTAPPPTET
jgi:monofunctional biosynthetic peptidoglycan transglycosylase